MFRAKNLIDLPVLEPLDTRLFPWPHITVCTSPCLCPVYARLSPLQIGNFLVGELSGLNALFDAIAD